MLQKEEIWNILTGSNIKQVDEQQLDQDMLGICKEVTDDRNVFRFSNMSRLYAVNDALLGMIGDKPKNISEALRSFRYWFHINRGSLGGSVRNDYVNLGTSMIGYQSSLDYRKAGIADLLGGEKKHSLLDKIKKG